MGSQSRPGTSVGIGKITLCKPHKVCISLCPIGWDDVKAKEQERMSHHFELAARARKATEVWWKFSFDCAVVHIFAHL